MVFSPVFSHGYRLFQGSQTVLNPDAVSTWILHVILAESRRCGGYVPQSHWLSELGVSEWDLLALGVLGGGRWGGGGRGGEGVREGGGGGGEGGGRGGWGGGGEAGGVAAADMLW